MSDTENINQLVIKMLSRCGENSLTIRGREFSVSDLEIIVNCVSRHYEKGRTYISKVVCKKLGWRQPNGWLKDRACRDVLRELEDIGFFELPPPLVKRKSRSSKKKKKDCLKVYDFQTKITDFPKDISLQMAKGNKFEPVWNQLVDKYHYLGYTVTVGRYIKYLIKEEDRLLGAISFASPAWSLSPRDDLLGLIGVDTDSVNDFVIDNNRFLILPHVQVPNLASKVLSIATKKIVEDWSDYYALTPLVSETFVKPSLFNGTCYKAANWLQVGYTKGYAKKGSSHHNSQEPKAIFLYGLNKSIRKKLFNVFC